MSGHLARPRLLCPARALACRTGFAPNSDVIVRTAPRRLVAEYAVVQICTVTRDERRARDQFERPGSIGEPFRA